MGVIQCTRIKPARQLPGGLYRHIAVTIELDGETVRQRYPDTTCFQLLYVPLRGNGFRQIPPAHFNNQRLGSSIEQCTLLPVNCIHIEEGLFNAANQRAIQDGGAKLPLNLVKGKGLIIIQTGVLVLSYTDQAHHHCQSCQRFLPVFSRQTLNNHPPIGRMG